MSEFQQRQQAIGNGSHAIVIGSGIAGLLAARVLLNHFEHITVVDRDFVPEHSKSFESGLEKKEKTNLISNSRSYLWSQSKSQNRMTRSKGVNL